jgi:trans-aconitate methyltransferase
MTESERLEPSKRNADEKTWDARGYDDKNSFVWKLGAGVIELLAPQPGERILDLGCGTGHLTNQIAAAGSEVIGIDKSASMIAKARRDYPQLRFEEIDAAEHDFSDEFDAVFSNAAIHWMRDQNAVARGVWRALKPGGRFVAEFGGRGNIDAIRSALAAEVEAAGETMESEPFARYYPTIGEYSTLLEAHGFRVTFATHFDRPTKLEAGDEGLKNWLRTFTDNVLDALPEDKREGVISAIKVRLRPLLFKEGSWFADYRRIRIAAVKE